MTSSLLRRGSGAALRPAAVLLAVSAVLAAPGAPAVAGTALARHGPVGRVWASWAYDRALHEAVLFGGDTSYSSGPGHVLGTTWTWTPVGGWTQQHPATSPSPRTGAATVYDSATRQLVLFGGSAQPFSGGGYTGDTWTWNGTTWTQLHPATSPPPRHNADLVYDSASHEVIMFGGYNGQYLGDTWAWNGATWTQLHPATSPPPMDSESLAYDPRTRKAILFGGYNGTRLGDTWSWDGATWTQLHPATSPGVVTTAWQAAWYGAHEQLILFGGDRGDGTFSSGTWAWTGATWTRLRPAATPGPRGYGTLIYDPDRHRLVFFGGGTGTADPAVIWEWNGTWLRPTTHPVGPPQETAYVVSSTAGTVTPIQIATNTALKPIKVPALPDAIAIAPHGKTAWVASFAGTVTPIRIATNTALKPIKVGADPVAIAIAPNGKAVYVVNQQDGTVSVISTATRTVIKNIHVGKFPQSLAITPDGAMVYVVNQDSNSVTPIRTATNRALREIPAGLLPQQIAITPDGKTAYVISAYSRMVTPIRISADARLKAIDGGGYGAAAIIITPDSKAVYVANPQLSIVLPISTATNTALKPIRVAVGPDAIAITPDGKTVYVSSGPASAVTAIRTSTNKPLSVIKVPNPGAIAIMCRHHCR